jgi:methylmalonyl-CoA mutase N-terminal domain/subunit
LAGSYLIESLTDELVNQATALIGEIDDMGGAVTAIEQGWVQSAIADAAYAHQRAVERAQKIVVGVNRFVEESTTSVPTFRPDASVASEQTARLTQIRATRDNAAVAAALAELEATARGTGNLLYPMRVALAANATVGEVCGVLRTVWGEYRPTVRI